MTAKEERRSGASAELWPLLGAIASGERGRVNRILEARPQLAVESAHRGATRETANAHFLDAIQHYVYAGDTALHIAAAAYALDVVNGLIGLGETCVPGIAWAPSRCTTRQSEILAHRVGIPLVEGCY